jgi:hypothetical protein
MAIRAAWLPRTVDKRDKRIEYGPDVPPIILEIMKQAVSGSLKSNANERGVLWREKASLSLC